MRIETNTNLVYDERDPLCQCLLSPSQGRLYAFVQAIDTGMDGEQRYPVRYWGEYSHDAPEQSIRHILREGGKWPKLPTDDDGE